MRILLLTIVLLALSLTTGCSDADGDITRDSEAVVTLQDDFDHLGPTMRALEVSTGRTLSFLDEGEADWHPVVFVGGSGTSGRALALLEFLRSTRQQLQLRFISVERNGFGTTAYDGDLGYQEYAEDVEALLDQLHVDQFSLFAISGGGPYSAVIANRNADRLVSVHLAAALTWADGNAVQCLLPEEAVAFLTEDPVGWWGFDDDAQIHRIPGFADAAYDDAARTFNMGGQVADPAALHHEFQLYCGNQFLPDLAAVTAPLYLYYGGIDELVPADPHAQRWQATYSNAPVTNRFYPGEGHDVQYRHFDQVLVDMAGMGDQVVVCDAQGNSVLVAASAVAADDFLGVCAWR